MSEDENLVADTLFIFLDADPALKDRALMAAEELAPLVLAAIRAAAECGDVEHDLCEDGCSHKRLWLDAALAALRGEKTP